MNQYRAIESNEYCQQITQRLFELISTGCIQRSDPKYQFFKDEVLPSLTFQYVTPDGEKTYHYRCPFNNCQSLCSTTQLLERHLREQHYDALPKDVFGEKKTFHCRTCNKFFKRQEHLKMHNKAKKHLKISSLKRASASSSYAKRWRNKLKQTIKRVQKNQQTTILTNITKLNQIIHQPI